MREKTLVAIVEEKKENREAAAKYFSENEYCEPFFLNSQEELEELIDTIDNCQPEEGYKWKTIAYIVFNKNIVKSFDIGRKYYKRFTTVSVEEDTEGGVDITLFQRSRWYDSCKLYPSGCYGKNLSSEKSWKVIHNQLEELCETNSKIVWDQSCPC